MQAGYPHASDLNVPDALVTTGTRLHQHVHESAFNLFHQYPLVSLTMLELIY